MAVDSVSKQIPHNVPVRRAIISVSDKTGLIEFATKLNNLGVELTSTGGTQREIAGAGIPVRDISEITGFPEIMDGRVKTLHPLVHGGLLGVRDNDNHKKAMEEIGIQSFDLLCVNLYPFEESVTRNADYSTIIENIDIGGPAMVRAAAKNHAYVTVVIDHADYQTVCDLIEKNGQVPFEFRQKLAAKAFSRIAAYDSAVSNWFNRELDDRIPVFHTVGGSLDEKLRYGENSHQVAGFYRSNEQRPGVSTATKIQGKALSFNNINDTNAAFEIVSEFDPANSAAVAIIKHANPCGVAESDSLLTAYRNALACDPVSAFGGVVALNRPVTEDVANEIMKIFTEVVIAPSHEDRARKVFSAKDNLRILEAGSVADPRSAGLDIRTVAGGILVQTRDNGVVDDMTLEVVTKREPNDREMEDLKMAFKVAKHVKSNAIVYVKDRMTIAIGAGQMSRVDSARIAAQKAKDVAQSAGLDDPKTIGSVVASDAFFPFADGLLTVAEAGATAVIQPGGSMRDDEVVKAADEAGLAMVFTGIRHFRH